MSWTSQLGFRDMVEDDTHSRTLKVLQPFAFGKLFSLVPLHDPAPFKVRLVGYKYTCPYA